MRNNDSLGNIFTIFLFLVWIISVTHTILWNVTETRKQTAETNKIVKEILAEKK